MASHQGLRERKKRATRTALSRAALALSAERGVESVTVEEIAAAAAVSPRTFFNYFSCKEEAILADRRDRADRMIGVLRSRPLEEPLPEALRASFEEVLADEPARTLMTQLRLVRESPAVLSRQLVEFAIMERALVDEVARRIGLPADHLRPRMIVAATVAIVRAATDHWIGTPEAGSLAAVVSRAMSDLERGLFDDGPVLAHSRPGG